MRRLPAFGSGALTRVCSWESSQIPNLTDRVRLLAFVLCRRGSTKKGSALGSVSDLGSIMLVRIQSSAL
jgi:hypothetical protein